ncbi:hypothetical protein LR965_09555, partial [Limosilactobacillus fermentum]|uniref:hypothetical protein n=1 Tax=Limosilactobacillus fermentum TaxID=1613 RepID=UPI001E4D7072
PLNLSVNNLSTSFKAANCRSKCCSLFSVGSDGHYLEHFRFHFDDLFALLKAKGVTELAIYQKVKRIMVPLPV